MADRERVHVEVNDDTIASGDSWSVIHPVWWSVTIYDGPGMYEQTLEPFSIAQRHVFAILWYVSEVQNGGHRQFYGNSTGIVWEDARDGFVAVGLPRAAAIITVSADRIGGSPSRDRQERNDQLEQHRPDFDDCDDALYDLLEKEDLEALLMSYIRSRPADFYFGGEIERVVLPGMKR
jgi:Domain of unknown function (DUF4375)